MLLTNYGANNAMLYAARNADVPAVALLSPGADYHGLRLAGIGGKVRARILVMTARGDSITGGGPDMIKSESIHPSLARVLRFEEIPRAHDEMGRGLAPAGNTAILVCAPEPGLGRR